MLDYRRIRFNLQYFAAPGDPPVGDPPPAGDPPAGDPTKPVTFDEMLKDPTHQSEFDKRVAKALATAKTNWEKEKNMTAEQLAAQKVQEREADILKREGEITRRELRAKAVETLGKKGLAPDLADVLNYTDEAAMTAHIEALEKAHRAAVEKAVNEKLKGNPPPGGSGGADAQEASMRAALGLPPKK